VTERLRFGSFGEAIFDVFQKDLPVFLSADAVLHALHCSFDRILCDVELQVLKPRLVSIVESLASRVPALLQKYQGDTLLGDALADVDLYTTVALSLLKEEPLEPHLADPTQVSAVWDAIQSEQMTSLALFSRHPRNLDFSQFQVRGHYGNEFHDPETGAYGKPLAPYFQAMMWLGRIDFWLTPPPETSMESSWTRDDLRRMHLGAFLLNELLDLSNVRSDLNTMDEILIRLVGESDNLTPAEYQGVLEDAGIVDSKSLFDEFLFDAVQNSLQSNASAGQKILSDFLCFEPFSALPDTLPVSFKLLGQRFTVDSYIFYNVVFPQIVYNGVKVFRPMPDPLDVLFVLGNENALPLLQTELDTYRYATQLSGLRYLVDAYDPGFWNGYLYNVWLQAIRLLNPPADRTGLPDFAVTAAWQHEKLNTQLSSWAELRHDNLLYAKQSYTGGVICSFPHSFVEPNPGFFAQIAQYAKTAKPFFDGLGMWVVPHYFERLDSISSRLETIARKEIEDEAFDEEEIQFLKTMVYTGGICGEPLAAGWYSELYYNPDDVIRKEFVVADVHTQPTDGAGIVVGRVLHAGVGKVDIGVFLADSPSNGFKPTAFAGPVMSYYEKITEDFDRLTDERWAELVDLDRVPERPDWINIYLADRNGDRRPPGRELQSVVYNGVEDRPVKRPDRFEVRQNYPNPFNPATTVSYKLPVAGRVHTAVYDLSGRMLEVLVDGPQDAGFHSVTWNASGISSGVYVCRIRAGYFEKAIKMVLIQ
jgi:hypothetical protein